MAFRIALSDDAQADLRSLDARWRATIREAMQAHLLHQPRKESKSRIKRLQECDHPQYRLRVGEMRVFYDVGGHMVEVLGIVSKEHAAEWLRRFTGEQK